jgi:quinol monooxygenase YgiN
MDQDRAATVQQPTGRYVYLWEFKVLPEREQEFLAAYGPSGAWSRLFRKAAGYVETLLLQDRAVPARFLTIDRWVSQRAHDAFLVEFRAEYEALDRTCESLTEYESSLGSYWELVDPRDWSPAHGSACSAVDLSYARGRSRC